MKVHFIKLPLHCARLANMACAQQSVHINRDSKGENQPATDCTTSFTHRPVETIRTSAMRVIHITVKTEETQRLRSMFVLYCSTLVGSNSWNQTKSTSVHWIKAQIHHSVWQQVDTSGNGSTFPPLGLKA